MHLPNLITLARVILVPVVFWLVLTGRMQAACIAFIIAGLSDAVDGFIAKRWKLESELGAYLDPLADKLLLVSVFIALGALGELPLWLVIAVVARDVFIVAAVLISWLIGRPVRIRPLTISKLNTAAQIVLAATVMADGGFNLELDALRPPLVWLTAALTVASLAAYMQAWFAHMAGGDGPGAGR